ncbi:uncharacterized protein LOC123554630 [Mercenaria mercenaria]|uniref:uncharacterized protein LOC123554630 n=1 Tax=Mercenaria mercenaria TaxID=6596 RepID=UPI00234E87E5|nr:uncharacterized protein LOC123554630 [Mercenaria mercenaria]
MVEYLKCSRGCLVVLVCTAVGELVVLVALVLHWRIARKELLAPKQQQLCFPLDKFGSTEEIERCPDGLKEIHKEKENVTVASNRYNSDINPEITALNLTDYNCHAAKGKQPAAKLAGLATDRKPVQVGTNFKLIWNSLSPSYALSGLTHLPDNGTINVEQKGFYYVFSQIHLKLDYTTTETDNTMKHYIHLISRKGTETTLLENIKSRCDMTESRSEISSFVGAVFELAEGDRLYVATSHPEHVISDRTNYYFSILRV